MTQAASSTGGVAERQSAIPPIVGGMADIKLEHYDYILPPVSNIPFDTIRRRANRVMTRDDQVKKLLNLFDGDVVAAQEALSRIGHPIAATTSRQAFTTGRPIIVVDHISRHYKLGKQTITALNDVSLTIGKGEFVAITGASGSGKSTLLQIIGGLDKPSMGTISIDDIDINHLSDSKLSTFRNQTIGFVFQFFYLQPFLRLETNTELPAMFAHRKRTERRSEATALLQKVGLSERASHFPKELSGGQMQRAAIARALLNNPKILLADEPTGNLDSTNSDEIIELFHAICRERGTTVIVVTHNSDIAAGADRVINLHDGAIA